ncbi:MAG TPA: TonB-dependent receptor [Candidatus Acidoferrales bacterium]|nr:TonB-dependent receptor [Candidatus Acidoferrales bacterium]
MNRSAQSKSVHPCKEISAQKKNASAHVRFSLGFGKAPVRAPRRFATFAVACLALIATPALSQDAPPPDVMKLSIEQLMNVDVDTVYGASKFEQRTSQAPAYVTIITADEIRKYGYRTLAEVLRSVPGLFVDYDRNYSYLGIRGFSNPGDYSAEVLLLIDGHRVNDNVYDSPMFGTEFMLDVGLIQRVEVIRGPASSLYGANAFFGVVNIITKRGRDMKGAQVTAEAGSLGTYKGRVSYGYDPLHGPEMLFSASYYGSHGNQDLFFPQYNSPATNNGVFVDGDRDRYYNLFSSVQYRDFSFQAAFGWRLKGIPTGSFGAVFNDDRSQTVDWHSYFDFKYQHTFTSDLQLLARVAYDRVGYDGTYVSDYAGTGIPPFTINSDRTRGDWWDLEMDVSKDFWDKHRITLGTETRFNLKQDQINNDVSPYRLYFNDPRSSIIPSVYAQDEYSIRKNVIVSAGLRYDHYDTFGGSVNPRVAFIYSPWAKTNLKMIYGQAFRSPSAYELRLVGNSALGPEKIKTSEVNVEQHFSEHLWIDASAFYNIMDGLIVQQTNSATGQSEFSNIVGAHTKGLSFGLAGKWPSGWEGRLAYTAQESRNTSGADPVNNAPKQLPKINLIAPVVPRKLFASFEGQYVSRRRTFQNTDIGGYFISNATLYTPDIVHGLSLSLSGYNLFDRRYLNPVGPGLLQDAIPQDGRTLRIKLTYVLGREH